MILKPDYILRQFLEDYMVVPVGEAASELRGVLRLSESGAFLWKLLESEQSEESLTAALTERYIVDEAQARSSVREFLRSLGEIGCLA